MTMSVSLLRARAGRVAHDGVGTKLARSVIMLSLVAGAGAGLLFGAHASAAAGDVELTHLLRAMALLKLLFVAAASAAVFWRLQAPISPRLLAAYAVVCAAMAAGPGLIWFLAYLGPAALLLHGGVAAAVVLLWRDDASSLLLERTLARRRASLHARR